MAGEKRLGGEQPCVTVEEEQAEDGERDEAKL